MIILTKKGLKFFEVSSSIQKSIRRGDEKTALYFCVEMFNSGFDEYVWKRLKIIVSEDVGLAEPTMPSIIGNLYQMYNEQKKKKADNKPERLFFVHAIVLLCRCKKSRLIDWYVIKLWREHDDVSIPIPDYAYDMHTQKGKSLGRGLDHFYNEGTILENHSMQELEEEIKKQARVVQEKVPGKLNLSGIKEVKEEPEAETVNGELWQE